MMPVNKCNWQILAAQHISSAQKLPYFSHFSTAFGIFIKNQTIFQNPFKTESCHFELSFKTLSNERPDGEEDFRMKSASSSTQVEKVFSLPEFISVKQWHPVVSQAEALSLPAPVPASALEMRKEEGFWQPGA